MTKGGRRDPENVAEEVSHRGDRRQTESQGTESQDLGWTPDSNMKEDVAERSFIPAPRGDVPPGDRSTAGTTNYWGQTKRANR